MPGTHLPNYCHRSQTLECGLRDSEGVEAFQKFNGLVTASTHHIIIINVSLSKAIIKVDQNIKWDKMPHTFNCTDGRSNVFTNTVNMHGTPNFVMFDRCRLLGI